MCSLWVNSLTPSFGHEAMNHAVGVQVGSRDLAGREQDFFIVHGYWPENAGDEIPAKIDAGIARSNGFVAHGRLTVRINQHPSYRRQINEAANPRQVGEITLRAWRESTSLTTFVRKHCRWHICNGIL